MEEKSDFSFVKNKEIAICGSINGILLDSLIWPYIALFVMQLILYNWYDGLVENYYFAMQLILRIITMIFTLAAGIFIAQPKILIKAYKKFDVSNVKTIFATLGAMIAFSFGYNLFLMIIGVDTTNGNANQNAIIDMIKSAPTLAFISTVILAPIVEEITYRYFLYGGIALFNKKWAIIISGFIFMSLHAVSSFTSGVDNILREILLLPPYMFSGMALAYAYQKSENLAVSTTTHSLNNLISFILCLI